MARLFWFTVEFGLIHEGGETRVYGSGLISSHGEAAHALGPGCEKRPFELHAVLAEPIPLSADEINTYHPALFVIESFEQVRTAMEELSRVLR